MKNGSTAIFCNINAANRWLLKGCSLISGPEDVIGCKIRSHKIGRIC